MLETLSIRIDAATKRRLDDLAKQSRRSRSFLAAEAIARFIEVESWQLAEIDAGLADVERGDTVSHEEAEAWLMSWGTPRETQPPK